MYALSFKLPIEYTQPVRDIFGVTADELSDEAINSIMIAGQAEQEILKYVPTFVTKLTDTTTTDLQKNSLMIAFINFICFYAYPSLKASTLLSESDNKTIATRFRDALTRDPNEFKAAALRNLSDIGIDVIGDSPSLLTFVGPSTDIITGV